MTKMTMWEGEESDYAADVDEGERKGHDMSSSSRK